MKTDSESRTRFVRYQHHLVPVWVDKELKGKHRKHCLCYSCEKFKPDHDENCNIANLVYAVDIAYHLTTPVWECPEFKEAISDG